MEFDSMHPCTPGHVDANLLQILSEFGGSLDCLLQEPDSWARDCSVIKQNAYYGSTSQHVSRSKALSSSTQRPCQVPKPPALVQQDVGTLYLNHAEHYATSIPAQLSFPAKTERESSSAADAASSAGMPMQSAVQQPDDTIPAAPSKKIGRQRKPRMRYKAQKLKMANLDKLLAEKQQEVLVLESVNIALKRRHRILSILIAVRDSQIARGGQLAKGQVPLDFSKYFLGASIEEVKGWGERQLVEAFRSHMHIITQQLAGSSCPERRQALTYYIKGFFNARWYAMMCNPKFMGMPGRDASPGLTPATTSPLMHIHGGSAGSGTSSSAPGSSPSSFGVAGTPPLAGSPGVCEAAIAEGQAQGGPHGQQQQQQACQHHEQQELVAGVEHWAQVVSAMRLEPEQVADMCTLYEVHSHIMHKLLADRAAASRRLEQLTQQALHPKEGGEEEAPEGWLRSPCCLLTAQVGRLTINNDRVEETNEEYTLVEGLRRGLLKERLLLLLVSEALINHILRTEQLVNLGVSSYPYIPNALAIVATVARGAAGHPAPDSTPAPGAC